MASNAVGEPDGPQFRSAHQSGAAASPVKPSRQKGKERLQPKQVAHLVHRLAIFACAVFYVVQCFSATSVSIELLQGQSNPTSSLKVTKFGMLDKYIGTATLRESRLVTESLANDTTPLADTIYVDHGGVSRTPCAKATPTMAAIYKNTYLRTVYKALSDGSSYRAPETKDSKIELIAPVVDCTIPSIVDNNPTLGRFYFLTRQRTNPQNVSMIAFVMSNQHYQNEAQDEYGTAAMGMVYFFHNTTAPKSAFYITMSVGYPYVPFALRGRMYKGVDAEGLVSMMSILPPNSTEMPSVLKTTRRVGYYRRSFSEQSNANNYAWMPEATGLASVSIFTQLNNPVLHDSWAWVHCVELIIGLNLASNLVWLCLATYHNFRAGKMWIGDAFVSVSTTQLTGGVAVLVSWAMSGFWTLREFCMHDAAIHASGDSMRIEPAIITADLLTLYFSACGVIGLLTRERIDPLLATVTFLIGFHCRISILEGLASSLRDEIIAFYHEDLAKSISPQLPGQEKISPMRVWSAHDIGALPASFIMKCLMPIFLPLGVILVYAVARKIYHYFYPDSLHVQRSTNGTATSQNERTQSLIAQKRTLTFFEIATGAQLESRYGLVADYETCRFIKGMKFASADGIYTTGFVIANHKFLVQTRDLWSILLMKILRKRFRNIYVYEVNGSTVQQTARLVYPHTLSFVDLLSINVSVLS